MYTAFATVVATVFMVLPYLVAPSRIDLDKASAYECGFDAFGEVREAAAGCTRQHCTPASQPCRLLWGWGCVSSLPPLWPGCAHCDARPHALLVHEMAR